MAENLDDGEFWLPSQFLADTDDNTSTNSSNGFSSDLSSPVESFTGTESDEDEFLAEFTREMTRYTIHHDSFATANPKKGCSSSGSPQSILSPVSGLRTLRGADGNGGSSRGSPMGPVSPPPAPAKVDYFKVGDGATLDLLHVAAGEVAKMSMRTVQPQKGTGYFERNRPHLCPPRKHANPNLHGFFSHQSELSQHQLQAFQFQQLWSQSQAKPSVQVISRSNIQNGPLDLTASAWPPLQHPLNRPFPPVVAQNHLPRSGMGAVILGNPASKRESTGTGVFLPKRINPTEPRKNTTKPDCSTVLVPEKVVQALNSINLVQSRAQPRLDPNGKFRGQSNDVHGARRNSENERSRSQSGAANAETHLPSEWTY